MRGERYDVRGGSVIIFYTSRKLVRYMRIIYITFLILHEHHNINKKTKKRILILMNNFEKMVEPVIIPKNRKVHLNLNENKKH